jgi:hypothetical protein
MWLDWEAYNLESSGIAATIRPPIISTSQSSAGFLME